MNDLEILNGRPDVRSGYKVDVSRGSRVGRVSSESFARPDGERYLSLSELRALVQRWAERSRTQTVESAAIRVEARHSDAEGLTLVLPRGGRARRADALELRAAGEPRRGATENRPTLGYNQ